MVPDVPSIDNMKLLILLPEQLEINKTNSIHRAKMVDQYISG
jgi:hypothetical protein